MTLFETLPQFTLFVLFFMVGFATRFFAQIAMFLLEIACRFVGTQVGFACQHIVANAKKAFQQQIVRRAKMQKDKEVRPKKIGKRSKQKQGEAFMAGHNAQTFSVRAKQKQGEAFKSKFSIWELIYFAGLGILTLEVFSKFDFVDFFWFIPLAVILGVVCNDYLTKEVFAKRKKV